MDYLYFLQNLRENTLTVLPVILAIVSELVAYVGPVVPVVLFFCIDKKLGSKVMFVFAGADTVGNVIKLGACVKRPWLRDERLFPSKAVMGTSSGYSFPSAHTCAATSIYGSIAQWLKKKKITIICVVMILLTAFSRNFLGMHTIWDVLAAIVLTVVLGFIAQFVFADLEKHPERDVIVLIAGLALCAAGCIYIGCKSYPLDLMDDGTYLYVKMQKDGFASLGMMMAWIICWFWEKRYINFSIEGTVKEKIIRGVVAGAIFCAFFFGITKLVFLKADPRVYYFFKRFISVFVTCGVYPVFLKKYQMKNKSKTEEK